MKQGSEFLHQRDPKLHSSEQVEDVAGYLRQGSETVAGESIPNEPAEKISAYLGFLANREYVNDGILTGDQASIDRQVEARVIKSEDVPEAYFDLQRRIARERGHGDVEITPDMRAQMIEAAQADQRAGLSKWVEYLGGDDGGYPDWFKYYTWESVTKLGAYDKEKGRFNKRGKGTAAPYPELNREALAYVFDALNKARVEEGGKPEDVTDDEQLQKLLQGGNFGKLYAYAVLKSTPDSPELRNRIEGSWTKYNQTNDPRTARRLAESLQGHGTGWCTAGESTAVTQLEGGDFYVYYSQDEQGKDTVPRAAIRMEKDPHNGEMRVAEVRGVNPDQELEPALADTVSERLKELPGGEAYIRKAEDMKRLTAIEREVAANPDIELSDEEFRFLYELDHEIKGFGYEDDPRIGEIRALRGDRDKPELARILPEAIREQLKSAYAAYETVAEALGGRTRGLFRKGETVMSPNELKQVFELKDKEWQESGVYDYLVEQLIESGVRYNLVATPNVEASEAQVVALAEAFGKDQPYETYVYDELYRKGRYTGSEWSGNSDNAPVRLSLIPSRSDGEISGRTAEQQLQILRERRASLPELNARVPSLLDAVTYWYALRAQGDKLNDSSTFDKTYIRHFDLEPKAVERKQLVPRSYVHDDGAPSLYYSDAEFGDDARLAVG